MCDQQRLKPACANAQSDQSICQSLEYSRIVKLLTENHLEFLGLKGGGICSSESTLVKIPHCWKSHVRGSYTLQVNYSLDAGKFFMIIVAYRFFRKKLLLLFFQSILFSNSIRPILLSGLIFLARSEFRLADDTCK